MRLIVLLIERSYRRGRDVAKPSCRVSNAWKTGLVKTPLSMRDLCVLLRCYCNRQKGVSYICHVLCDALRFFCLLYAFTDEPPYRSTHVQWLRSHSTCTKSPIRSYARAPTCRTTVAHSCRCPCRQVSLRFPSTCGVDSAAWLHSAVVRVHRHTDSYSL